MRTFAVAIVVLSGFSPSFGQQPSRNQLSNGTFTDNVYRNPQIGFTYKILLGWVDRTDQSRKEPSSSPDGQVLLAVFERPPEVKGEDVNSAVIIAAESLSSYPGVKTAADYFDLLTEATTSQGFKVVNEPYEIKVGTRPLVRSDFSKELGKLTMYQSSLVILAKGHAVSFTFIASSEDEIQELVDRLSFTPAGSKQ
jgi:hypothetical protein